MKKMAGFTLFELLMAIVIIGILTSFAIPAFKSTVASTQLNADKEALKSGLNLARLEAISRPTTTSFESNGTGGWQVRDTSTGEIIRTLYISGVDSSIQTLANPIVYGPTGFRAAGGSEVTFQICNEKGTGSESGRRITVSKSGSVRTEIVKC